MSGKYPPPPAGLHRAIVSETKPDLLSKSGSYKMARVDFSLLSMGCAGARVSRWYITGKANDSAKEFPIRSGREELVKLFAAAKRPTGPVSILAGAIVNVIVQHNTGDDGNTWPGVAEVLPDDPANIPPSVPPTSPFSDDGHPF